MDNVIKFRKDKDTYYKIAKKRREDGDLIGALSCLFSSLKAEFSLDAVKEIADIYSQMCIYELSNKYWYLYLSKAPKNRKAEAFEGLGVNYFLSDDVKTGNYYFDLRAKHDGLEESAFVSESIIEKLQDFYNYNSPIRLVYPPESADFNEELFKGKFALSRLEGKTAIEFFSAIPKGSKQYGESRDGIATAYYLCGDFDSGIKVLKETIAEEGENTGNLCKLSQFYKAKSEEGDNKNYYAEKSKYYYEKARDLGDKDMADVYKLAFSSFEHGDDKTALYCMEKIIVERENTI
ncbi:MAG: hypothetical protein IJR66_05385 [Clostridia bacterium]|nr:hypothetical protein [Clostridia bacterium]